MTRLYSTTAYAHRLFDQLLRPDTLVPSRSLNGLLAVLALATSSASRVTDWPGIAVALFSRVRRAEADPSHSVHLRHPHGLLLPCASPGRPGLGLTFLGRLLRTDRLKADQVIADNFLKCLYYAKRTDEAVAVLLHLHGRA
ncbi:hypothetical protein ZWY2020_001594 [Hordeum vulgare]|nr:hypothetical protein ZWY2020_001594 [Hordeum vulgare]